MGKGGPLAFLNKKTWHPGRIQNMEEVWKREQEAAKEQQRMEDLKKQIYEERAKEEMNAIAEAAGVKVRKDKLDWMYQGGVGARQEADQRHDAQTGDGVAENKEVVGHEDSRPVLPSYYQEDTPASANEMWQRLHGDPLFAMKQREIQARRSIIANPVKMDAIKSKVKEEISRKEDKHKKKKHNKEKRHRDDDSSSRRRHRSEKYGPDSEARYDEEKRHHRKSRAREDDDYCRRDYSTHDGGSRRRKGHEDGGRVSHDNDDRRKSHKGGGRNAHHDSASAQRKDSKYGISFASHAPDAVRSKDRSDVIDATRKRLEEAAWRKEQEERENAAQRYVRREHKVGRISEEEKQRRLREMTQAAHDHDVMRITRVKEYDGKVEAEAEQHQSLEPRASNGYLHNVTKGMYENGAVSDAVGRRKAYSQRTSGNG